MKCEYCNQEIVTGSEIEFEGHYFCNSLHRYAWKPAQDLSDSVPRKGTTINRNQLGIIAGIIAMVVFGAIGTYLGNNFAKIFGGADLMDKQLTSLASEINKSLPMMVDAETRWDNTGVLPGKTVFYNYTLINYDKADFDTITFRSAMEPLIKNLVKTNPQLQVFRDKDVTFIYNYKDNVGVHITQFKYYPKDYK